MSEFITHIDFAVNKDCLNIIDSYGEICVHCNCCGRFKGNKFEARVKTYKRQLEKNNAFDNWFEECKEFQRTNVKANADHLIKLINEAEAELQKT